MDKDKKPIILRRFDKGVITDDDVIDPYLAPKNSCALAINMNFDKLGAAKVRGGLAIVGAQISSNLILGLYQFVDAGTGTASALITVVTTVLYTLETATWTSKLTGLTTGLKARFTTFLDYVFFTNGTDAVRTWDGGGGAFGTTNAGSAPTGKYIERFKNRVWIASTATYPSRLFFSSLPSTDATPVITWTSTDYIEISPSDGEDVTALRRFDRNLFVFKKSFCYPVYSKDQTEPDPLITVGTHSQESVVVAKDGMYWHHPSGIYRLRRGEGQPKEISRPIYDIIRNVAYGSYDDVASWSDDDHVFFSVGDVTYNNLTISNCVIRWTISTEVWTIYSYSEKITVGARFDTGASGGYTAGTAVSRVVGSTVGRVFTVDSGTTDNTSPIHYQFDTQWWDGGSRSLIKRISKVNLLSKDMVGAKVSYRSDRDTENVFKPIGSVLKFNEVFDNQIIEGTRIKLNVSGVSSTTAPVFSGFEILDYDLIPLK